eukprot:4978659-Prorocentrum_lima.AAC.1
MMVQGGVSAQDEVAGSSRHDYQPGVWQPRGEDSIPNTRERNAGSASHMQHRLSQPSMPTMGPS